MLALAFIVMVGVALIADGFDMHIPRGYVYFAMAFSAVVESLNLWMRARGRARGRGSTTSASDAVCAPGRGVLQCPGPSRSHPRPMPWSAPMRIPSPVRLILLLVLACLLSSCGYNQIQRRTRLSRPAGRK